jgi:transposase
MRSLRETLRLRYDAHLSYRQIARCLGLSLGVVSKYLTLAEAASLRWPLPDEMDDATLERAVLGTPASPPGRHFAEPDFAQIHTELKRPGVTLSLLWQEYREAHPDDGYQYTQFSVRYRRWRQQLARSMRQTHRAGQKLFVDFSGKTVTVIDPRTGPREAQIFVAVLGASRYTYAEATWTQTLPDVIAAHCRAFAFFQGAAALLVPDCLKAAVTRPCRYDPGVNRTYQEMAEHYGCAVLPARPYHPKDKAAVETAVLLVQRWILARLRNRSFSSLAELNEAILALLVDLNDRPFTKLPGCRRALFEQLERDALRPLPQAPYRFGEWTTGRVGVDYHVEVERHYYSVPHALVRRKVDVRISAATVEIFHKHTRVASHLRSATPGAHSTVPEHMPAAHRAHLEWSPQRLLAWAAEIGPSCQQVVAHQLRTKPHPEHGYRTCLGLQRLARGCGATRLEAACRRALVITAPSYASIASILKLGLDRIPMAGEDEREALDLVHENIRGAEYYAGAAADQEVLPC